MAGNVDYQPAFEEKESARGGEGVSQGQSPGNAAGVAAFPKLKGSFPNIPKAKGKAYGIDAGWRFGYFSW